MKRRLRNQMARCRNSIGDYSSLEPRRMLAGNVNVFQTEGILYIRGDGADNQIQIDVNSSGDVVVEGVQGTTINRAEDSFVYDTDNGFISSLRSNLGAGDDSMFVEKLRVSGRVVAYGGAGNDDIGFFQSRVEKDLLIQTFSGDDNVSIDNVSVLARLIVTTLDGNDTVGIDNSRIADETLIATGEGNDRLAIRNSNHGGFVFLGGDGGDDFISAQNLFVQDTIGVYPGQGADNVLVADSVFESRVFVNGGDGSDSLEVDENTQFRQTVATGQIEGDEIVDGTLLASEAFTDLIRSGARLGTIVELATITPQLSTLLGAVQATGLTSALNSSAPLTVFAPTNDAFAAIDDVVQSLSLEELSDVLKFHVAPDAIFAEDLVLLDSVDTLLEQPFSVDTTDGVVLNGNATLAATDIRAKNGVVHVLNEVLVPAS